MDTHPASLGNKTDDRIAWRRLAAARHVGQQVANPEDLDFPFFDASFTLARCRPALRRSFRLRSRQFVHCSGDLRRIDITPANGDKHLVDTLLMEVLTEFVVSQSGNTETMQLALQQMPAVRQILLLVLLFEPPSGLGAGT